MSSGAARVLDKDARCRVHSTFTHTMNIQVGRDLVMLAPEGRPESGDCPFGLEIRAEDWRRIRNGLRAGSLPTRWMWHSDQGRFTAAGSTVLTVTLQDAALPAPRRACSAPAPAVNALPALPQNAPTPGLLQHHTAAEVLARLRSARDAVIGRGHVDDVLWLIGRGPGLTPSGDDALVGILAALTPTGRLDQDAVARLASTLQRDGPSLTTDVSLAYLGCALRGEYGRAVTDVIDALGDQDRLELATRRLARHGHTSGVDLLLGMIIGMEPVTGGKAA